MPTWRRKTFRKYWIAPYPMWRSVGRGATVRIEKNYQPDLPPVPLDETLAEQAFVNIIQNAYDAMITNGGELSVKAQSARQSIRNAEAVDGVEVRIADTGPGIPAELREQI